MSNPLRLFRKYQAAMLVGFGIVLMFAFVVGPVLQDYLSTTGPGTGGNATVVSWKGGKLSEAEMDMLRAVHRNSIRFLMQLTSRVRVLADDVVVERDGEKIVLNKGATFQLLAQGRDPQDGLTKYQILVGEQGVMVPEMKEGSTEPQIQRIMPRAQLIAEAAGEEELVRIVLLAEEARKQGVVISEEAVYDYLDNLCDVTPETRPNYAAMLSRATSGNLQMRRFVAHLAEQLAAQRMLYMSRGGLYAIPPDVLYECYNKLHRRVSAELLAVDVSEFVGQVADAPESELKELYEQGKNDFPDPLSEEPGFKRRQQLKFGFVVGSQQDFLDREKAVIAPAITDEEIAEYYNTNKETYRIVELPDDDSATQETGEEDADTAAGDAAEMSGEGTSEPEEVAPKTEEPKTEEPKTEEPKTEEPKTEEPKTETPKTETPKTETPKTEGATGSEGEEQAWQRGGHTMFVSYQEETKGTQEDPKTEEPKSEEPKTEEPKTEEPKTEEPKTEEPKTEEPKTEEPKTEEPKTEEPKTEEPKTEEPKTEPEEEPAKYKPLDDELRAEIRDTIASDRARPIAEQKLSEAIDEVMQRVDKYGSLLAVANSDEDDNQEQPEPIDVKALAESLKLTYVETPLWDSTDVNMIRQTDVTEDEPAAYQLARATEVIWSVNNQVRRSIADVAYGEGPRLYGPEKFVEGIKYQGGYPIPPTRLFAYWRIEEVPETVPTFKDAQDEVLKAWQMQQALPLAKEKAAQMAKEVNTEGKSLTEVFPSDAEKIIFSTQFSWMTRGAVPGGMGGQPMLSPINGTANGQPVNIFGAGDDFMRDVFALNVGEAGVATNQPQTFVYVVRVASEDSNDEDRRETFYTTGLTPDVGSLVEDEQMRIIRDWLESLEKDYDLEWEREPREDTRQQM